MSVLDTLRIESAVQRYDLALDLYGVAGRRRRGLRRELRANLRESASHSDAHSALRAIGSPEQLARESADAVRDPRRPAWSQGFTWGVTALALYVLVALWSTFSFMDGAFASGVDHEVRGHITLLPGVEVMAHHTGNSYGGGFTAGPTFGLACLVIFLVVFALTARVWRPLRRRSQLHD